MLALTASPHHCIRMSVCVSVCVCVCVCVCACYDPTDLAWGSTPLCYVCCLSVSPAGCSSACVCVCVCECVCVCMCVCVCATLSLMKLFLPTASDRQLPAHARLPHS